MTDDEKFAKNMAEIFVVNNWSKHSQDIVRTWYDIEDEDPDISTEKLAAMVMDITDSDYDSVIDTMIEFSELMREFRE